GRSASQAGRSVTALAPSPATTENLWAAALRSRNFVVGAAITAVFVLMALISFVWTPYDPAAQSISTRFAPPFSPGHLLGSDHFGRDTLSMIMVGARTSIAVALLAVGVGVLVGV